MSDRNIIEFPSRLHDVAMEQVLCQNCGSRAMRLVSEQGDKFGFDVECHNCGDELIGLKVVWDQLGTT